MADLPCPSCGNTLAFIDQYQRYYCLRCGQYAPEGYGDRGGKRCTKCGGILAFVVQYNRFFCYRCNAYAQDETAMPAQPAQPLMGTGMPIAESSPDATVLSPTVLVTVPPVPETSLVAATPPAPAPTARPIAEATAPPAAQAETKPPIQGPSPTFVTETASADTPPEAVPPEPSREIQALAASKPAVVRVKIFALKKSELIDLCKAYALDPSGTKEQVQERLLSYLHDLESEEASPEPISPVVELPHVDGPGTEPAAGMFRESIATSSAPAAAAAALVQIEKPVSQAVETVSEPAPVVVEVPRPVPKAGHPCPTCGRELTFISQYDRYYCYSCQRYAPATRAKGACPTCGATMRWIDQHERWWCDSCQKYASADLPKPATATATVTKPAAGTAVAARAAVVSHHHANPALGIGLIGVGLALWVIYEFLAVLAPAVSLTINNPFTDSLGAFMVFFAFLFVAAGAMVGLSNLRDRI